jgi:hypothetical protein
MIEVAKRFDTYRLISIEPKMKCHPETLVNKLIEPIKPHAVSIGADSGRNNLPEPDAENIKQTMKLIRAFAFLVPKKNLRRLLQLR